LHANIPDLFLSLLLKIYFISFIEFQIGIPLTVALYFITGVGGIILYALFNNSPGTAGSAGIGMLAISLNLEIAIF
jgi:hypothetical protein